MPDTRGIEQDENHKESIVRYIEQYVDVVNAVLILSHGTNARYNNDADYTFSALSAFFPKTFVRNIAIIDTQDQSWFTVNYPQGMVSEALKNAPMFPFDGATLFWLGPNLPPHLEEGAFKMLVELFDWLDSLEPCPATEIVTLHQKYQNIESMTTKILDHRAVEAELNKFIITFRVHSAVSLSPCTWRSRLMLVGCRTWIHSPTSRR